MECYCGCGRRVPRRLTDANLRIGEVTLELAPRSISRSVADARRLSQARKISPASITSILGQSQLAATGGRPRAPRAATKSSGCIGLQALIEKPRLGRDAEKLCSG